MMWPQIRKFGETWEQVAARLWEENRYLRSLVREHEGFIDDEPGAALGEAARQSESPDATRLADVHGDAPRDGANPSTGTNK